MAFEVGKKYQIIIVDADRVESKTGTLGLNVKLRSQDGASEIWHTEWITAKTEANFLKRMGEFGIERGVLESEEFWEDPLSVLAGKKGQIETMLDEYDGRNRVRVKWLNGLERPSSVSKGTASRFAEFFRRGAESSEPLSGSRTPFDNM